MSIKRMPLRVAPNYQNHTKISKSQIGHFIEFTFTCANERGDRSRIKMRLSSKSDKDHYYMDGCVIGRIRIECGHLLSSGVLPVFVH